MTEDYFDFDIYKIPASTLAASESMDSLPTLVIMYQADFEAHETLFAKIFKAAGLEQNKNLQIMTLIKGEHLNLSSLTKATTKQVISFGVGPDKLGFNAKFRGYYNYQTETFSLLLSHSLRKLAESKEHKKALWEALKVIYLND